jgi:hypothetical protein
MYTHVQTQCDTHLISFRLEAEGLASVGSGEVEPLNHDLVVTKALDHDALGFWKAPCPPPKLSLPKVQLLPWLLLLLPGMDRCPSPIPTLLESPGKDRLWTLKLVLELAGVTGEVMLVNVALDARCESASLVDVGDGGARG